MGISFNETLISAFNGAYIEHTVESKNVLTKYSLAFQVSYDLYNGGSNHINFHIYSRNNKYKDYITLDRKWGFIVRIDLAHNWFSVEITLDLTDEEKENTEKPDYFRRNLEYTFDKFNEIYDIRRYFEETVFPLFMEELEPILDKKFSNNQ